jgi:hypothetical protein
MLTNVHTGFQLHVPDEHKANGDPVIQWDSTSVRSHWNLTPVILEARPPVAEDKQIPS